MEPFAPLGDVDLSPVSAVCIGTGRFLRAVLVPALSEIGCEVVLAQTRGKSFPEYMMKRLPDRTYEVDTVLHDGRVLTTRYPVAAVGSLGDAAGRAAFMALPSKLKALRYVGLGLTEAGIAHNGKAMNDLAEFLHACMLGGLGADVRRFVGARRRDQQIGLLPPGRLSPLCTSHARAPVARWRSRRRSA